jgi:ATP-binding cassette, subfamily B, bacterial PglK
MLEPLRKSLFLLGPGHRGRWLLVVALALVASGFEVLGALLIFWLLTRITTEASGFDVPLVGDLRALFPGTDEFLLMALVGAAVAAVFLLRAAAIVGQSYVQHRVAENAGARLASRLLAGYLAMPSSFHLQRNSAELIRTSYDTVQGFVREALVPGVKLVAYVLMAAGLVAVLLVATPWATLIALVAVGTFTAALFRLVHPRVERLGRVAQEMARTSLQTLNESLAGWREITILGRRDSFVRQFEADRRRLARARYLRFTAKELPRVGLETGLVLFVLAFLGVTALVTGGALDALPVLGLFGYVAVRLQPLLNEIMVALNSLRFVSPGIDLIHRDLRLVEAASSAAAGAAEPLALRHELRLENVSFRYPGADADALVDVDTTIRAGEFVGVVGPTGGGKTTLVDVVVGLLEPTAGSVRADGVDVYRDLAAWHATLGVVHQVVFLADTTLRRNIALGVPEAEIDDARVAEAVELARLGSFVRTLPGGLDTVVGEKGMRVSGGERQRIAIARALYRRPSVLVLDEGTSALDDSTELELLGGLEALRGERTVVAVAHRLRTVRNCDRVLLIEGGRLVDAAPFEELASRHRQLRVASG